MPVLHIFEEGQQHDFASFISNHLLNSLSLFDLSKSETEHHPISLFQVVLLKLSMLLSTNRHESKNLAANDPAKKLTISSYTELMACNGKHEHFFLVDVMNELKKHIR